MLTLLILQFIAHVLADFIFQPQQWCEKKDEKIFSTVHLYHTLIVFGLSWLCSMQLAFWWAALVIATVHFLFDILKSILSKRQKLVRYLFFADQTLHLAVIVMVICWWFSTVQTIITVQTIGLPDMIEPHRLLVILSFLLCTKPANIVIREILKSFEISVSDPADTNELLNAGKLIGSLERIISLTLILANQFAAVGFIIAAKSLLRFRDTATARTEYLLIGTLLSFGIAILLGIACR